MKKTIFTIALFALSFNMAHATLIAGVCSVGNSECEQLQQAQRAENEARQRKIEEAKLAQKKAEVRVHAQVVSVNRYNDIINTAKAYGYTEAQATMIANILKSAGII